MIQRKWMIVVAVLTSTAGVWVWQHAALLRQRASRAGLELQAEELQREIDQTRAAIKVLEADAGKMREQSNSYARAEGVHAADVAARQKKGAVTPNSGASVETVALNKSNLRQFRVKPVTEDFQVSDAAAALLGMTAGERAGVNGAIEELITRHMQLDIAKARPVDQHLTREPGKKTTFQVPAYPEEGQALMDRLVAAIQKAVGSERAELLLHYAELSSISADGFDPFGRAEKTITFLDRPTESGERGDCQIFLRVKSPALTLSTSFQNRDDKIPKPWRHLIEQIYPARQ
jgi:hypothetical protein